MSEMTPREIVSELILASSPGQRQAFCGDITLRNRWPRMQLNEELRSEVTQKIS
ncbi:hypothetical protein ACNKHL_24060 [Shigella flexneri]